MSIWTPEQRLANSKRLLENQVNTGKITRQQADQSASNMQASAQKRYGTGAPVTIDRNAPKLTDTRAPLLTSGTRNVQPKPLVEDLPIPQIPQQSQDQMFTNGIQNKRMADLTPEEINQLLDIERRKAEAQAQTDLSKYYSPLTSASSAEVSRLEAELRKAQAAAPAQISNEVDRAFALVDQKYTPALEQIRRQGDRQIEDTQRTFSFGGAGRGNRALEARQGVLERVSELEAAKNAEAQVEKQLLQAQIEGRSQEEIDAIASRLNAAKTNRASLEGDFAKAQAELNATLATTGANSVQAFLEKLQTQASLSTYDPNLSSATGKIVDSQGRPVLGPDGAPLEFASLPSEVSTDVSKQLGYLADNYGQAIVDSEGRPIPINKPVKGTFKDGAKNTYILYEDGSVQQVGATMGGGGGGSGRGGSGGASGFDPALAPFYEQYLNLDPNDKSGGNKFADTLKKSGLDLTQFANEAVAYDNYLASQEQANQVTPEPTFKPGSKGDQFINNLGAAASTFNIFSKDNAITGGILNWLNK